jgi:hypothetical protein
MILPEQLSGPVRLELDDLIALLRDAELVDIKWGTKGMLCGWSVSTEPKVLALVVADEDQAWAINHAKEALSAGDEEAAYVFLSEIADENRRMH